MGNLYSIGYSNKQIDEFINLLKKHNIHCIIDVRSTPFSSQFPDYNQNNLEKALNNNGIYYRSYKDEFGARRIEKEAYGEKKLYDDRDIDVVIFKNVYELDIFKKGYRKIVDSLKQNFNMCFLCSEKYPYDCHRAIMVSEYFYSNGYMIAHIVDSNTIIMHNEIDSFLKENFESARLKFNRLHNEELKELLYSGTLFGVNLVNSNLKYWDSFFKNYTREKGIYLRNLEIGYQKGNDAND